MAIAQRSGVGVAASALLLLGVLEYPIERAIRVSSQWDKRLSAQTGYRLMQAANAASPRYGRRLVQFRLEGANYFYDGVMIGDWFGPGRYSQMWSQASGRLIPAEEMRKLLDRFDARLFAADVKGFGFDEADYAQHFDVLCRQGDEILFGLKPSR